VAHGQSKRATRRRTPKARASDETAQGTRRILIVEDDPWTREFIDRVLREAGYATARMVDGQEGLEFAEQFGPFDLLLTDVVMPRMDGAELARRLRRIEPHLKVLYFTGYRDRLFQDKAELWDDEALLDKPASPTGILKAVSELLSEHAACQ
jgi:CheY-like chemotaxis protein